MQIVPSLTTSTRRQHLAAASLALLVVAALAGCAGNVPANFGVGQTASASVHYSGSVYGGQQPVANATIQLMTVGTAGLRSAATNILNTGVTTDTNGNFSLTGKYTCGSATQVYLLATGGDPGGGVNSSIGLAAALGSCVKLMANASNTFISVNEVTTVAAAYALAPFATSPASIGAAGPNTVGILNAFSNAISLANTSSGSAGGPNLPAGATVPVAELNTLADILAACVNSGGAASAGCSSLLGATGASDTFGAALGIAKNPGAGGITALYSQVSSTSPFQPTLATQPRDFSVAITYTGGGTLATPYGIAIDTAGNAWVTNESGDASKALTELVAPNGASQTYGLPGWYGLRGVAADIGGNIWVAATAGNLVARLNPASPSTYNAITFASGFSAPSAIALDYAGNVFVTDSNANAVTELVNTGSGYNQTTLTGSGNITVPSGIAVGPSGDVFVTSGNGYAVKLTNTGAYSATYTDNALQGPVAVALDPSGDLFMTGFTTGAVIAGGVSEFNAAGNSSLVSPVATGISSPAGVATDGTSAWVVNSTANGSLAKLNFGMGTTASPTGGFGTLNTPVGVAIDGTGSVWTANSGSNTVSKFIGIATPVTTPLAANHTFVGP